jgi:hypothetical protein
MRRTFILQAKMPSLGPSKLWPASLSLGSCLVSQANPADGPQGMATLYLGREIRDSSKQHGTAGIDSLSACTSVGCVSA